MSLEGRTISHFRILSRVAEGGMGVVYRAEDVRLGRIVALKVLPPHRVSDPERRARFVKEARSAAAVTHPGIATIHEIDEAEGIIFIAMEYIEGQTLRSFIGGQPLPLKNALHLAAEMAEGLAAAHQAHIVHRDFKPDNVIVTRSGHAKILDFGLARLLGEEPPAGTPGELSPTVSMSHARTGAGVVLGTAAYMSPEQARGQDVDFRTDIFSFGGTLYEMLTGRPPFAGRTATDTISNILNKEPVHATALNPDLPPAVQWTLDKCLEKDPAKRYQDTRDLAVDLQRQGTASGERMASGIGTETPSPVRTDGSPSAAGGRPAWVRPALLAVGAGLAVLLSLAAFRLFRQGGAAGGPPEANSLAVFSFENLKDPQDPQRLGQIFQELIITDLSGLQRLKVFSSQRLFDIQKQLGRRTGPSAGRELATEVATRARAQTMLTGSLSQLGEKWILTCQLVDVGSGKVVQSRRIDGTDLYAMVDDLTDRIQSDLRILIPADAETRVPVKEKTSTSVEAYQRYLAGTDRMNDGLPEEAAKEFEKAIEIDPRFGKAYYRLAISRWWSAGEDWHAAEKPLKDLLSLGLYASPMEKAMAEGFLGLISKRYGEGIASFERLTRDYPDEKEAWYGLGEALYHFPGGGRQIQALEAFKRATVLDPDFAVFYHHIFNIYLSEHMAGEARAEAEALLKRDPANPTWHRLYAVSVAMKGNEAEIRKATAEALEYNRSPEEGRELYKWLAQAAGSRGDLATAFEMLRKALEMDPGHDEAELRGSMLQLLWIERKFKEVQAEALKALQQDPTYPAYQRFLIQTYDREWRFKEILEKAESFARQSRDDPSAYREWGRYAVRMGDEKAIGEAMAEAARRNVTPDDRREFSRVLGEAHQQAGNLVRAGEYFQESISVDPEHPDADPFVGLGEISYLLGDDTATERSFSRAMEINPKHWGALFDLVTVNSALGNHDKAIEYAKRLSEYYPVSWARGPLILAHIHARKLDEAGKLLEVEISAAPTPGEKWDLFTMVGWAYLSAGEFLRAEETYRRAGAIDPGDADPAVLLGLAWSQVLRGNLRDAEEGLKRALSVNPRHGDALLLLAVTHILRKDYAGAEREIRRQVDTGPVNTTAQKLLAVVFMEQGRFTEALPVARNLVAIAPTRECRELLAWIQVRGNLDVDEGKKLAEIAVKQRGRYDDLESRLPFWPPAEHTLGLALLKEKRYREAVETLQRAAARFPRRPSLGEDLARARHLLAGPP